MAERHQQEGLVGLDFLASGEFDTGWASCPMPVNLGILKAEQGDLEFEVACFTYQDPVKKQSK